MNRSLLSSVTLHLILALLAWAILKPRSEKTVQSYGEPILVEVEKAAAKPKATKARHGGTKYRPVRPLSLKDLAIQGLGTFLSNEHPPAAADHDGHDRDERESSYGFENQLTTKSNPILAYLFRRIDGGISYPSELSSAGLSGEVTASLKFDSSGHWIESPADIHGNDLGARYLRIYLLRRMREILADPVPENLWKADPQAITIDARFTFAIVAPESVEGAQIGPQFPKNSDPTKFSEVDEDANQSVESRLNPTKEGFYGRKFAFYRAHLSSPLDWKLGPLAGYGIMPAVGIDPSWFVDTISDLIHHRAKIDPLDKYREDPEW